MIELAIEIDLLLNELTYLIKKKQKMKRKEEEDEEEKKER